MRIPHVGDKFLPGVENDYEVVDVDEMALDIEEVGIEQDDGSFAIFVSNGIGYDAHWSDILDCWVGGIE